MDRTRSRATSRVGRTLAAVGSLTAAMLLSVPNEAAAQHGPPEATGIRLPERAHRGEDAVKRLGRNLETVGRWYGKSGNHLAHMLRTDPTLWVDRAGKLFYQEQVPAATGSVQQSTSVTGTGAPAGQAVAPLSQTFFLNSKPGAKRTLYLDFNGHVATGTVWNSSYNVPTISSPAFDTDGNPSSFSDGELTAIQKIWMRVAEDFAPFDVNVTTQEPPTDLSNLLRDSSTDDVYGFRAVITRDFTGSTAQGSCGCGGFSYVGVIGRTNNGYYMPSYIFFDKLASNEKYIAEAVSHELGHALGLSHDGTSTTGYYSGQGSGTTSWAPIMGVGYSKNVTQWSKGDYPDANNLEDDITIIARNLPLRVDDVGNTYAQSKSLTITTPGAINALATDGIIETASDVDVFNFYSAPGAVSFTIRGPDLGQNVDVLAELRDAAGNILASSNPVDDIKATINANVPAAGQYFLVVTGVAKGDFATGYPDYASIGQYWIVGQAPSVAGTPPTAVAAATPTNGTAPLPVNFSSAGSTDPDGSIVTYEWNFGDGSPLVNGATASHTYQTAGTYNATLRVVDNSGFAATTPVTIVVSQPVVLQTARVSSITMSAQRSRNGNVTVTASVLVTKTDGTPVSGAAVSGGWSGKVTGTGSGTTGTNGVATIRSPRTSGTGSVTFTVNGVSATSYKYDASLNVEGVDTISF